MYEGSSYSSSKYFHLGEGYQICMDKNCDANGK